MKNLLLSLFIFALGCVHTNQKSDSARAPAGTSTLDEYAVYTFAVDDYVNLFAWVDRYDTENGPRPILEGLTKGYDREIEKGNLCMANIKQELEQAKQNPEIQSLCRRYKMVNDYFAKDGQRTVCAIAVEVTSGWTGYYYMGILAAPYIADAHYLARWSKFSKDKFYFDRSYDEVLLDSKLLDKKSYAQALANNRCHFDSAEIIDSLKSNVLKGEARMKAAQQGIRNAKNAEEVAEAQAECFKGVTAMREGVKHEVERIANYIPRTWLTNGDQTTLENAKITIAAPAQGGDQCASELGHLTALKTRLADINANRAPKN